jgi:hypothetical protein
VFSWQSLKVKVEVQKKIAMVFCVKATKGQGTSKKALKADPFVCAIA